MATSYSDLGITYNHPSIVSNVYNNDTIFQTSSGKRPFFYTITSDKGIDNKIKLISTEDEFIFNYGEPNLKLHGQAAYNILRILQAGESVYVLRVMPENAGYSHAFLNIQTKIEGTKMVKNINGQLVPIDNVIIKPTVTYSKTNNTSKELLDYELTVKRDTETIDGYKNNLLFYVYPKGRGSHYDKYGFRIYLNPSYDETYSFRVYNFEVIEFDEYDNASVIEGPFYVSFDPEAMSASNESMFIEDVVNRYSSYLSCEFNEEAYDTISTIINPDVAPSHLDLLSGETRVSNNERENFFCKETQKYEDVHIRIQKYDAKGNVILDNEKPLTTLIESTDKVEQSIIAMDNSARDAEYKRNLKSLENMKNAISDIGNDLYLNTVKLYGKLNGSVFADDTKVTVLEKELEDSISEFNSAYEEYTSSKTETNYNTCFSKSTLVESKLEELKTVLNILLDYAKVVKNSSSVLNVINQMQTLQTLCDTKEIISIKILNYKNTISELVSSVLKLKTIQSLTEEANGIKLLLVDIQKIISYYSSVTSGNSDLTSIKVSYNNTVDLISKIEDEFESYDKKEGYLVDAYTNLDVILPKLIVVSNDILLSSEKDYVTKLVGNLSRPDPSDALVVGIITNLQAIIVDTIREYETAVGDATTKSDLIVKAKEVASIQQENTKNSKSLIYTTQLQNFNSPVQFNFGSNGDLDNTNATERNKVINNLLIKGYTGLIDDSITNKKIIPARFVLDANYSFDVKNALNTLVTDIRNDIFMYADLGITSSPEEALSVRNTSFNISNTNCAIYGQDAVIYDEFNGKDIKVTATYFLANKIPKCSTLYGLHYPIAGNKRGTIEGFKSLSWVPNETYKELLYNRKINYIESDTKRTKFGSQLTSESINTALSNINNVITVMDIKNDIEVMAEDYQFEFNDQDTINVFQNELNDYLATYTSSKAAETIEATVYASDYDKLQKIIRVKASIKFYDIIERVAISLEVVKS